MQKIDRGALSVTAAKMNTVYLNARFRKNNIFTFTSKKGFLFHSSAVIANVTLYNFVLQEVVKLIQDFII